MDTVTVIPILPSYEISRQTILSYIRSDCPKKYKLFSKWTDNEILYALAKYPIIIDTDPDNGRLTGFAIGKPDYESFSMDVFGIAADGMAVVKNIYRMFRKLYPGWTITSRKHGHDQKFLQASLDKKLLCLT